MSDINLVNVYLPVRRRGRCSWTPPLGCLYLLSALERGGIDADFQDYQTYSDTVDNPMDPIVFADFVRTDAPILAFSCMFNLLPFVLLSTRIIKERYPEKMIVLGGPGPSGVAENILRAAPWVDVVASGEGEVTIVETVHSMLRERHCQGVPGVTCRVNGNVTVNSTRSLIRDIDVIPLPAYDRLTRDKYTDAAIMTARGCSKGCTFCDVSPYWDRKVRKRGLALLSEELERIRHTLPNRPLTVRDDTFSFNRSRMDGICELLRPQMGWACLLRVDHIDEELCGRLADAGCKSVLIGVESGSDRILAMIKKGITKDMIAHSVSIAVKHFREVVCTFMWGFPEETLSEFEETSLLIAFAHSRGAVCQISLLSPMPYSTMYNTYRNHLAFSKDLISNMVTCRYFNVKQDKYLDGMSEEMLDYIAQHRDLFVGFCHYDTPGFAEKVDFVASMGMDTSLG